MDAEIKYSIPDFETDFDIISEPEHYFTLETFELYKFARNYRKKIYNIINDLPPEEKYALNPQMRRAVISISNNIAEGHGRWHYQENLRFCRISRGSTEEIIDDINICIDENYYDSTKCRELRKEGYDLIKKINSYISYLKNQKEKSK
jgi:four helix bundle protein